MKWNACPRATTLLEKALLGMAYLEFSDKILDGANCAPAIEAL